MVKFILKIIVFVYVGFFSHLYASHITGGEITVQWVTGNNFEIQLRCWRDCSSSFNFPTEVTLHLFELDTHNEIATLTAEQTNTQVIPQGDPCTHPSGICVEECSYTKQVIIPNHAAGYYIAYQTCCRDGGIISIQSAISTGMTYYAEIPDPALQNSTPVITSTPQQYMCTLSPNSRDFSATDINGDSLHYSLVEPFTNAPIGNGPYQPVTWSAPYNANNMINSMPGATITQNGILLVNPQQQGAYIVTILVEEFDRNTGNKLGEIRRDIRLQSTNTCNYPPPPVVNLGPDTVFCVTSTYTLTAPAGMVQYVWSTGDSTSTLQVDSTGEYVVTVKDNCNNIASDTVMIEYHEFVLPAIPADTTVCFPQSLQLDATTAGATHYLWNGSFNSPQYMVTSAGTYQVVISYDHHCSATLQTQIHSAIDLNLGEDLQLCYSDQLWLDAGDAYDSYNWNNGSTQSSILVNVPDTYYVQVTLQGCSAADTVVVKPCLNTQLFIPNSFSPNGDGQNDVWFPVGIDLESPDLKIEVRVFNRWGQEIYVSNTPGIPWNGGIYNSSEKCPVGIYAYSIYFRNLAHREYNYLGNVNIMK